MDLFVDTSKRPFHEGLSNDSGKIETQSGFDTNTELLVASSVPNAKQLNEVDKMWHVCGLQCTHSYFSLLEQADCLRAA